MSESSTERLWKEYSLAFRDFDDLTLARWLSQTLGQLQGRVWRFSHPLVGAFRLAAELGHKRQIWLKRLANAPAAFPESACCRAPLLPVFTRDIVEAGLICQHCAETVIPFDELPAELQDSIRSWGSKYAPVHAVAHWDEQKQKASHYQQDLEDAAGEAEKLLVMAAKEILPRFLDYYPAIIWEDQDECLEVAPDDLRL